MSKENLNRSRIVILLSLIISMSITSGCLLHQLILMTWYESSWLKACAVFFLCRVPNPSLLPYVICIQLYSLDNHIAQNQTLTFAVFMYSSWPCLSYKAPFQEKPYVENSGTFTVSTAAAYYRETHTYIYSHCLINCNVTA